MKVPSTRDARPAGERRQRVTNLAQLIDLRYEMLCDTAERTLRHRCKVLQQLLVIPRGLARTNALSNAFDQPRDFVIFITRITHGGIP